MENSGLPILLKQEKFQDIELMYNLFSKDKRSFELMCQCLQSQIKTEGSCLVAPENMR
jgi:hypothetical protein